jgi:uncharacterized protein
LKGETLNSKILVDDFLTQKKIALVGVSQNKRKFGNAIHNELKKKGFEILPVHPKLETVNGDKCFPSLSTLPGEVDNLIVSVAPGKTLSVVEEAKAAGIKKIWIQRGSQSLEATKFCNENNIDIISGECILMFAEPSMFIHKAHKWINKVSGKLPV